MKILKHNMLNQAAEIVKNGGVIVYPTDTVWGIGCNALNKDAVQHVIAIKNKPADSKLITLFPSVSHVKRFIGDITWEQEKMLNKKRTTVIIKDQGIRVVKNGWLNKFLIRCNVPLISTSANMHGEKVVSTWRQAVQVFGDKATIIRGPRVIKSVSSTVVSIEDGEIKILRKANTHMN